MANSGNNKSLLERRRYQAERQRNIRTTTENHSKRVTRAQKAQQLSIASQGRLRAPEITSTKNVPAKKLRISHQNATDNASPRQQQNGSVCTDDDSTETVSRLDNDNSTRPSSPDCTPTSQHRADPRVFLSLSERRRSRRQTPAVPIDMDQCNSPGDASSTVASPVLLNRMKAQLAEALSEKRTLRAALDLVNEKCVQQESNMRKLSQHVKALESMINKRSMKGRRSSKKGTWNKDDDNSIIAPYKGVRLQLDLMINSEAALIVTESTLSSIGKVRMQDWTASSNPISIEEGESHPLTVKHADGKIAVPNCTMLRCFFKKFYIDRFESTSAFVRYVTEKILDESMSFGMSRDEREECVSKMSSYPPVISKCRTALREETNNSKQGARNTFLRLLCYKKAHLGEDKKNRLQNDDRLKEKRMVYERCVRRLAEGDADTMYWRTTPYSLLYNTDTEDQDTVDRMLSVEDTPSASDRIDFLFVNEASRVAFTRMRGYSISEDAAEDEKDASIIWLARADAWITTAMLNIRGVGKGGAHSNEYIQNYENLLPKALECIIKDIWDDLHELSPEEVRLYIPSSESDDEYGNRIRKWTYVLKSSDDGYLYPLVTPSYISKNLCSWIGNIKDCQIGRCLPSDEKFVRITKDTDFHEIEDSDIEEEQIEPGTGVNDIHLETTNPLSLDPDHVGEEELYVNEQSPVQGE